ncbi:MAG: sigma-70 family RNA polymerase sigma factor [Oscillospiraceae bacterium]|jgi:RNA polymerase sporulation-specific sigma factor|nr:sigma-70 family RNA polymerase sigma factor [Oscillospiraceae bacterium]
MITLFSLLCVAPFLALRLSSGSAFEKPLSQKEEKRLVELMKSGDKEAQDTLIVKNMRLVAHIVKKFFTNSEHDKEDLIQIGTIGLIKAVRSFDPDKNIVLSTYAAKCIQNEILMHMRRVQKIQNEITLDEPLGGGETSSGADGSGQSRLDMLPSDTDLFESVSNEEISKYLSDTIREVLTEREREVIARRYGLEGFYPQTQQEASEALHCSRSYVSRIESGAIAKLRETLGGDAEL